MPTVEPIKVLTVDDVPLNVAEQSEQVQHLVTIFDDWNQKEADARSHLMMVSAAKDTLSRQIINQVRDDNAPKEVAAETLEPEAVEVDVTEAEQLADEITDSLPDDVVALTGDVNE